MSPAEILMHRVRGNLRSLTKRIKLGDNMVTGIVVGVIITLFSTEYAEYRNQPRLEVAAPIRTEGDYTVVTVRNKSTTQAAAIAVVFFVIDELEEPLLPRQYGQIKTSYNTRNDLLFDGPFESIQGEDRIYYYRYDMPFHVKPSGVENIYIYLPGNNGKAVGHLQFLVNGELQVLSEKVTVQTHRKPLPGPAVE